MRGGLEGRDSSLGPPPPLWEVDSPSLGRSASPRVSPRAATPPSLPPIYSGGFEGSHHLKKPRGALSPSISFSPLDRFGRARRSPAGSVHHHHHQSVVLSENSSTSPPFLDGSRRRRSSSNCTCAERGGAVRLALDRDWIVGWLAIWIAKTFDYINRVS